MRSNCWSRSALCSARSWTKVQADVSIFPPCCAPGPTFWRETASIAGADFLDLIEMCLLFGDSVPNRVYGRDVVWQCGFGGRLSCGCGRGVGLIGGIGVAAGEQADGRRRQQKEQNSFRHIRLRVRMRAVAVIFGKSYRGRNGAACAAAAGVICYGGNAAFGP
jgi:hypothetical protein